MDSLYILAFTHSNLELDKIGRFHLEDDVAKDRLTFLKDLMSLNELMYLSTCNRVEFVFVTSETVNSTFIKKFFRAFNPSWSPELVNSAIKHVSLFNSNEAAEHLFKVASSLDSLVIGEREIITQVRKAYEQSNAFGLTGDVIRLLAQHTVQVAKKVYTESDISKNPVSVVSLAYHKLREKNIKKTANFLIVGAGKSIKSMLKFLSKHGYSNYSIYNRSKENALQMVDELDLNAEVFGLNDLNHHSKPFDVIITCTGSSDFIFTKSIYNNILRGDVKKKIVIDLAVPSDFDETLKENFNLSIIAIKDLKKIAEANLSKRSKELSKCKKIVSEQLLNFKVIEKERKLERAMSEVPTTIKDITTKAYSQVFAKDLESLDEESRVVLDKFVHYLEKKYISVPMKMAKEILLKQKVN
ncbi:MAG: glutamyl-tRNA reductase [Bacteroidota bacterium]|nr:glutamyl-tRNA reductase [Bacteroidota bacterium]